MTLITGAKPLQVSAMNWPTTWITLPTTPVDPRVAEEHGDCLADAGRHFATLLTAPHVYGWRAEEGGRARAQAGGRSGLAPTRRDRSWTSGAYRVGTHLAIRALLTPAPRSAATSFFPR